MVCTLIPSALYEELTDAYAFLGAFVMLFVETNALAHIIVKFTTAGNRQPNPKRKKTTAVEKHFAKM